MFACFVLGLTPLRLCLVLLLTFPLCACSGLGHRVREAASAAATDPWTWTPLGAAMVMAGTGNDERVSRWAKTENPLFGSREDALLASDQYRLAAVDSGWASVGVAALADGSASAVSTGTRGAAGGYAGVMTTRHLTGVLKETAQRERPHNGPTRDSFPSAHSSDAFAHATLARYHLNRMPLNALGRAGLKTATSAFAVATAWARVEGGVHYPSDVLFGAALANFTTRFFLEFAERRDPIHWRVRPETQGDGVVITIERPF